MLDQSDIRCCPRSFIVTLFSYVSIFDSNDDDDDDDDDATN